MREKRLTLSPSAPVQSLVIWNILGSTANAAFYMLLLMVVNRLSGEAAGGVFSIGYAVAVLMWSIGSFETGPYQVTDHKNRFSFGDYLSFKLLLCGAMLAASAGWMLIDGTRGTELAVTLLLCLFKALDAFSGVFYSRFQKYGRLDISGKSLFFRIVLSMAVFVLVLAAARSLTAACAAACAAEVVWILFYDMRLARRIVPLTPSWNFRACGQLFRECLPLFVSSFGSIFLTNLPKYTIDGLFSNEVQSYFGALFMPASVINLMSLFVFRPLLTTMAREWNAGEKKAFQRLIVKLFLVVAGLTALAMGAAWLFGIPVLSWLYGVDLSPYPAALAVIMLGGGFSAAAVLAVNVLTVMRRQWFAWIGYVIGAAVSLPIAHGLVSSMELTGAAVLYAISMFTVACAFLIAIAVYMRRAGDGSPDKRTAAL